MILLSNLLSIKHHVVMVDGNTKSASYKILPLYDPPQLKGDGK